ncbi:Vacuolar protein sorting-associated protein 1 [Nosema granulosis]|uniref:Vacuolar protein sorting-associated protein 1 n=1 Tax=Nosema granulosis TaxID=83296 RepID=A0A9P6H2X3_9MICR|nr:Vacuolar protein sorting-associated protein 1 [Nosema granulosis]
MSSYMDLLIEKINELQDICNETNIHTNLELPQIVVIGSQSSGKSSVMENIIGRDLLPRGVGIVTRRPLILQLIYKRTEDHVVFNHIANRTFTNFEEVKAEIINETNRIIKSKNDVSNVPITLKFYSSKVITLTLVDLPGLIRVPTNNQPKDICSKVYEMCKKYVSNKNALILAVSAANTDISNSDALQLAREVDPNYERTIGVLTKIDLMDSGTDVIDILAGRIVKLNLGFVPVVNRGQSDIENKKDIASALKDEANFFMNHPSYKKNVKYCGTAYLVTKLHSILQEHIKYCLPDLQERINSGIIETQKNLSELGVMDLSPKEQVMKIINDVSQKFRDSLKGNFESQNTELVGGARINYTFNNHFSGFVNNINPLESIKDDQIRAMLYNSSGSSSVILFSHSAFEQLAKTSIQLLKPHSIKLVSIIFGELVRITNSIISSNSVMRFPALNERISTSLIKLFKEHSESTHKLVESFIEWNISYISTKHPDFIKWNEVLTKEFELIDINKTERIDFYKDMEKKYTLDSIPNTLKVKGKMSYQESVEIGIIKSMVVSYFEIVKKIVIDQVPKAIMHELVYKSSNKIQERLFLDIYDSPNLENIIVESSEISEKRNRLHTTLKALKQAYDLVCSL